MKDIYFTDYPIFKKLLSLNLPNKDFAIFGSGPMWAHGITDISNDLDLIARGEAWERALKLGNIEETFRDETKVTLFNNEIEIFEKWGPGTWDTNILIEEADIVSGIRFVKIENVLKWKQLMKRDKDIIHIKLIEDYLKGNSLTS